MNIFIHGNLYGMDSDAFTVEDGIFTSFGNSEDLVLDAGEDDEIIDLNHSFVSPGFIDSHLHLVEYGAFLKNVQLQNCFGVEDILRKLSHQLERVKQGEWLLGRGFNEEFFDVPEQLEKRHLDSLSTVVPIAVTRSCGHKMVVNSKALELAGIDEDTQVEGGVIDFERGMLEENAVTLLHSAWPEETEDSIRECILRAQKELNRYGITSVGSDDFVSLTSDWRMVLRVFSRMAYKGELTVRVNEQCEFPSLEEFAEFLDEGNTFDDGDDFFRIGPLKLITDGSLGARTAALKQPYSDDPTRSGYMTYSTEEMEQWIQLATNYNMPTICHAIGDRAVEEVLNLFDEAVLESNPLHHGLVHCQIMDKEEIRRAIDQKLICYVQSLFIDTDAPMLEERVGTARAETSYPFHTLYEGTIVCNGSDAPVETPDVMKGIELAVTRTMIHGDASMNPKECMNVEEALASYTINGAKAMFAEDRLGKLQEGALADFAVLSENPRTCEPKDIHKIRVLMTVMNGEIV